MGVGGSPETGRLHLPDTSERIAAGPREPGGVAWPSPDEAAKDRAARGIYPAPAYDPASVQTEPGTAWLDTQPGALSDHIGRACAADTEGLDEITGCRDREADLEAQ